jgi:glutamine amidotransferase
MLTIVDCGLGNLGSIENMLKRIGCAARVSSQVADIAAASKIILPGIGAFDQGMRNLRELGLEPVLREKVLLRKTPVLGICLGMQMLGRASDEGTEAGLGWIAGSCRKFGGPGWDPKLKIPHMGWNFVSPTAADPLLAGFQSTPRFYFVHSYHVVCDAPQSVIGTTDYGGPFASVVRMDNIFGAQFHPEKSHRFGMVLLRNFVERI